MSAQIAPWFDRAGPASCCAPGAGIVAGAGAGWARTRSSAVAGDRPAADRATTRIARLIDGVGPPRRVIRSRGRRLGRRWAAGNRASRTDSTMPPRRSRFGRALIRTGRPPAPDLEPPDGAEAAIIVNPRNPRAPKAHRPELPLPPTTGAAPPASADHRRASLGTSAAGIVGGLRVHSEKAAVRTPVMATRSSTAESCAPRPATRGGGGVRGRAHRRRRWRRRERRRSR